MILAGKAYYDGVAKIGEIATGSPVSTELGELTIHYSETELVILGTMMRRCKVASGHSVACGSRGLVEGRPGPEPRGNRGASWRPGIPGCCLWLLSLAPAVQAWSLTYILSRRRWASHLTWQECFLSHP